MIKLKHISFGLATSPKQSLQIIKLKPAPMKILVAEDDKANQMVTSLWLDEFGYDHEVAGDGEEAIEKFKTGKFSIILMDVGMHKINGYEATKSIRAIEKSNKLKPAIIIAFTARGFLGDREKCLQSGMDDYLSKPIDYMALNNYLANIAVPRCIIDSWPTLLLKKLYINP